MPDQTSINVEPNPKVSPNQLPYKRRRLFIVAVGLFLVALLAFLLWPRAKESDNEGSKEVAAEAKEEANEVVLPSEALAAAGIETAEVAERPATDQLTVSGSVETNAESEQFITPLVAGRIATVNVSLGQQVGRGSVLATIESPQIAELRGQLSEAKSKLALASANATRVRQTANRVGLISAKAKLELAEKELSRQRRLHEIGAGSLKDVQAAEAGYETSKAEYDYQANVALAREVQTAESERESARATVERLRQALIALGADPEPPRANAVLAVTAPARAR